MANLAIRGHEMRGKEVIEILEMLGGKNVANHDGSSVRSFYFLNNTIICSSYCSGKILGIDCYTLKEFLEKFPYKVGDKAFAFGNKCTIIDAVWDESIDEVVYAIKLDTSKYTTTKLSNQLQPYKEETMENKSNLLQQLKEYFNNTPREVIEKEWHEYDRYNEIGPTVNEYLEYVNKSRQSEYPKTYDKCFDVLEISKYACYCVGYQEELLDNFQKLIVCRDAYWKIAGEQMGLGKPWKQDYNDRCFIITNNNGNIHTYEYHGRNNVILAFPTKEMRDAFYENFKDLIKECKELL